MDARFFTDDSRVRDYVTTDRRRAGIARDGTIRSRTEALTNVKPADSATSMRRGEDESRAKETREEARNNTGAESERTTQRRKHFARRLSTDSAGMTERHSSMVRASSSVTRRNSAQAVLLCGRCSPRVQSVS